MISISTMNFQYILYQNVNFFVIDYIQTLCYNVLTQYLFMNVTYFYTKRLRRKKIINTFLWNDTTALHEVQLLVIHYTKSHTTTTQLPTTTLEAHKKIDTTPSTSRQSSPDHKSHPASNYKKRPSTSSETP